MKQIKKGIYMQTQPQILELVLRIIYNYNRVSALKSLLKEEIHCKKRKSKVSLISSETTTMYATVYCTSNEKDKAL